MRSNKVIHVVSCHAEGEVGDVIVGGVSPPPGDTLWEQRKFIEQDHRLRRFVLDVVKRWLRHVYGATSAINVATQLRKVS